MILSHGNGINESLYTKMKKCLSQILLRDIPLFLIHTLSSCIAKVNHWTTLLDGKQTVPVYDLINAGPKHRYASSDVVVSNCAADYGLGFQNNLILMDRFDIPVVQMNFVRQNTPLGFATTNRGNERWTIDKTSGLRAMFMAIKYGRIYFPPYLEFEPYTADLLSPFEHVIESGGLTTIVYQRDPARPDDFAMALCFVLMAAVKLAGLDILSLIPKTAFASGIAVGKPQDVLVDPKDYTARE